MKKTLIGIAAGGALLALWSGVAFAASVTVGNPAISRANVDTYSNFTIIDTNNPVSATGDLGVFQYYAANTNPFEFVLVNSSDVVQWISPTIDPASTGQQIYISPTPVPAQAGWNLGVHFDDTGTIPFDYTGAPASYTPNNDGMPSVGETLSIEGTSDRMYSWNAGTTTVMPCTTMGTPFLTMTQNISGDPDSGNFADWATDTFTENVNVWLGTDGVTYCANAGTTNGTFVTTGPGSPQNNVPLAAGIHGTFTGGENYVFPSSLTSNYNTSGSASVTLAANTCPSNSCADGAFSNWVSTAFSNANAPYDQYVDTYSLTYITSQNGTWTDADANSGGESGDITGALPTYTVQIDKYLNGKMATASSAKSATFPMVSSWNAANLGGAGSGSYSLGTADSYQAVTSAMDEGSSYATNEVTGGSSIVSTSCSGKATYELVGYSTGATEAAAQTGTVSATAPNFSDLEQNEYVIVWNKTCPPPTVITVTNTNTGTVTVTTTSSSNSGGNVVVGSSNGGSKGGNTGGSTTVKTGKSSSSATSVTFVNTSITNLKGKH